MQSVSVFALFKVNVNIGGKLLTDHYYYSPLLAIIAYKQDYAYSRLMLYIHTIIMWTNEYECQCKV